jgi:hypothetical protein
MDDGHDTWSEGNRRGGRMRLSDKTIGIVLMVMRHYLRKQRNRIGLGIFYLDKRRESKIKDLIAGLEEAIDELERYQRGGGE